MTPEEFTKKFNWSLETLELARATRFRCVYCNKHFFESLESWISFNVEHIRPRAKTHDESPENKTVACWVCNKLKGSFDPGEKNPAATREELIEIARQHIEEVRIRRVEKVDAMMKASQLLEEANGIHQTTGSVIPTGLS